MAGTNYMLLGDQAGIGRFVSKPGTQFRFALRFVNLRPWELGALLLTLQPTLDGVHRLHAGLPESARAPLARWMQRVEQKGWNANPARLLAHKLGHGRPLGMGSVTVRADGLRRLAVDAGRQLPAVREYRGDALREQTEQAIDPLAKHLAGTLPPAALTAWVDRCLLPWLEVHRYAGRRRFDYPRRSEKGQPATIFNHHTHLRGHHADGRKRRKPSGPRPRAGLPELHELE
jgi:hypothetical protein